MFGFGAGVGIDGPHLPIHGEGRMLTGGRYERQTLFEHVDLRTRWWGLGSISFSAHHIILLPPNPEPQESVADTLDCTRKFHALLPTTRNIDILRTFDVRAPATNQV